METPNILPDWISTSTLESSYERTELQVSQGIEYMELIQRTLADRALRRLETTDGTE